MDYSLRELECFIAVAEELSFTRAAKRLRLAQPPLSRHVRTLEAKIGAALFHREPRRSVLTPAGKALYEEVRDIPRRLTAAGQAARQKSREESVSLRLGFVSAVMNDRLVEILHGFRRKFPSVQIMLHDLTPSDQLGEIQEGRLDGGFIGMALPERPADIRFTSWHREPLACFVPAGHLLASRKAVAVKELAGHPFIAVSNAAAPAFASHVRGLCNEAGIVPRIILESTRAQAVALMVAAGSGIAILPVSLARFLSTAVVAVPLKRGPAITHVFASPLERSSPLLKNLTDLFAKQAVDRSLR